MAFTIEVNSYAEMKAFLEQCLEAGILRCVSPEREELCDDPATRIHWQDEEEWYPSCEKHFPCIPQWCGCTRFCAHTLEVCVITDKAKNFLATLPQELRDRILVEEYEREE